MTKALGQERADNMLARITPPTRSTKLAMLKWMEAGEIAAIIEGEHPQVMALVLAHLEAPVAAASWSGPRGGPRTPGRRRCSRGRSGGDTRR